MEKKPKVKLTGYESRILGMLAGGRTLVYHNEKWHLTSRTFLRTGYNNGIGVSIRTKTVESLLAKGCIKHMSGLTITTQGWNANNLEVLV